MRALSIEDAASVAAIDALLFHDDALSESTLTRELRFGIGWGLGDPLNAFILVRDDGVLLDVTRLAVTPAYQGKGAGRQLLSAVLAIGRPVVLTVRKNNRHALALYLDLGFRVTAHLREAGAWVMQRG